MPSPLQRTVSAHPEVDLSSYRSDIERSWGYEVTKRVLDVAVSAVVLILLMPVFFVAAIAIKLDSPGPILFVQTRVGKNGKLFRLYKFRSMRSDSDRQLAEAALSAELPDPGCKVREDPRVTSVGRILRKLSIDELPQLINVILGDMSLVGPRPLVPGEGDRFGQCGILRLLVRPGLTCFWQVSGRSDLSFEDRVQLDLKYLRERGLLTDIKLILMTIPAVILCKGAY